MTKLFTSIIFGLIACCAMAESTTPTTPTTPPQQSTKQDLKIVLWVRHDNKSLRAPSKNPIQTVEGIYDNYGTLSLFPDTDTMWTLIVSTISGEGEIYYLSTSELQVGINIGSLQEFNITLANDLGETFEGDFCCE